MSNLKKVTIVLLSFAMFFISLSFSNGHFLQVGEKVNAAGTLYYYNKYNTTVLYSYTPTNSWITNVGVSPVNSLYAYTSWSYNSTTGVYTGAGSSVSLNNVGGYVGWFIPSGGSLYQITNNNQGWDDSVGANVMYMTNTPYDAQGTLIQSNIKAFDGTYPNNGKHSDGYWYVKGAVANYSPTISIISPTQNGTLHSITGSMKEVA